MTNSRGKFETKSIEIRGRSKKGIKGELNYPLFVKKQNLTDHRFKYTESIATKIVSCDQNCCFVLDESF